LIYKQLIEEEKKSQEVIKTLDSSLHTLNFGKVAPIGVEEQ
jgi:hypothetical protein